MWPIDKYRKKRLEKDRSRELTGLIPLHRIHSMGLIIDASAGDWEECVKTIRIFCTKHKIELHILAIDLETKGNPEILTASDVNILGFPKRQKSGEMLGKVFNFLLCICDNKHFCIDYIVKCIEADMKAGLSDSPDNCYDIAISTPKNSPADRDDISETASSKASHTDRTNYRGLPTKKVFETVAEILKKIK